MLLDTVHILIGLIIVFFLLHSISYIHNFFSQWNYSLDELMRRGHSNPTR